MMDDRTVFLDRLKELSGAAEKSISMQQIRETFADLKLGEKQLQEVVSYLRALGVTVLDEGRSAGAVHNGRNRQWPWSSARLTLPFAEKNQVILREYLDELLSGTRLSRAEDEQLSAACLRGDEQAAALLAQGHLHLAFQIAREYYREGLKISFYDLIQEGNLGLYTALSHYQGTGELSFGEYACLWIRQSVLLAIARSEKEQEFSAEIARILNRIREASADIARDLGEAPAAEELAQYLEIPLPRLVRALSFADDQQIRVSPPQTAQESEALRADLFSMAELVLPLLYPLEQSVLRFYLGLQGRRSRSMDETAVRYGMSQERIRQILARARHKGRILQRRHDDSVSEA